MGLIKRHLENVSVAMGYDGEINEVVMGCAQHAMFLEEKHLREPMTLEQIQVASMPQAQGEGPQRIDGIIFLSLNEIIGGDIETFDTKLSERLTGTDLLLDIHYALLGVDVVNDKLYFRVEGDPSMILEQ